MFGFRKPGIRVVCRAVICKANCVLLLQVKDGHQLFWCFPGGRQEFGETSIECVVRECREELNCDITVNGLLTVSEWIPGRKIGPSSNTAKRHFHELFFLAEAASEPDMIPHEKLHQKLAWVDLDSIHEINLLPKYLRDSLPSLIKKGTTLPYSSDIV